ncbi:hypothetical protein Rhe02_19550 [Rhizocola hellebori]|uniref:Peptide zinc metalloprotease protein n=2 Tax=Rhizocola hellebori TaxID=1392758 RepID=A0A8J3Q4N3_9ACTN|nr:hypothetical protein Rhe02_19550 [Rhizocola hellebori]
MVSPTAHFLLSQRAAGVAADDLAQRFSARAGQQVTEAQVQAALAKLDEQVAPAKVRPGGRNPFGLWVKVPLLPSSAVVRAGRVLSPLFHPAVVAGLGVVLGYLGYLVATGSVFAGSGSTLERGGVVWPALVLVLVSGFMHELGHTTASIRYGAPGGQIGFGLYLVYPVFYSDVSAAWTLPRRKRVVVDVGGVYFQLLMVACYLLLFRFTGWEAARLAALGALGLVTFALIPIFKFDGYWLLSDTLGVPNLSAQVGRALRQVRDRVLRRRVDRLPWPGWVTCVVVVYGVFSMLFLGYLLFHIVPAAVDVAVSYPARIAGLGRDLSAPPYRPATGRLRTIIFPGFLLVGVSFGLFTIGRRLVAPLFRIVRRKHDKAPAGPAPASGADDADRVPGTAAGVAGREDRQLLG